MLLSIEKCGNHCADWRLVKYFFHLLSSYLQCYHLDHCIVWKALVTGFESSIEVWMVSIATRFPKWMVGSWKGVRLVTAEFCRGDASMVTGRDVRF